MLSSSASHRNIFQSETTYSAEGHEKKEGGHIPFLKSSRLLVLLSKCLEYSR